MEIYLDNAATSYPKPEVVLHEMEEYFRNIGVSSGRGVYRRALQAEEMVYDTRRLLGKLFNIEEVSRLVFTLNITESLNLALKGILKRGDHVVTTHMEHNAVWRPLKVLEKKKGIRVKVLPCPGGRPFDPEYLREAIEPDTRLVVLNHASNVTGTLMPIKEAGEICQEKKVPLLLDTAQTAGVYPLDLQDLKVDLLAFTGHKGIMGPTGTGGLYISPDIQLEPLKEGGTGGDSLLEHQPPDLPQRYEAGTLNLMGIAGLKAAVVFLLKEGVENIRGHELMLTRFALEELGKVPEIKIYGPQTPEERVAVIAFNLGSISPGEVAYILDEIYGIMVRAGLHCAPQAHRCLGTVVAGTVRIGMGYFNRKEDIVQLCRALKAIISQS
ncbi:MAG: aminotransferase class V-fold PLP-dependent enzyme [Candidatus Syntrophonatronum acetioxidans]|uniref:cysteine desulfurase n=1 Tax=Candidatus Syntrophonatronum acetioxidans TaxID=1795816 RepID=A0A424YC37_9FIRM|nr:MAG: aminotransferase class V-fold PLP-dependent enzyme [Candidatus Syntrophonatronum acetioxidans]